MDKMNYNICYEKCREKHRRSCESDRKERHIHKRGTKKVVDQVNSTEIKDIYIKDTTKKSRIKGIRLKRTTT